MASPKRLPGSVDWAAAAYYNTGVIPADTDSAYFEAGGDTIASNMDQSGIDLTALYVGPGFRGNIDGLRIDVNQGGAGVFIYEGSGQRMSIGGGTGAVIAKAVHRPFNGSAVLTITHGTVTLLEVISGLVVVAGGVTVTTLRMMGGACVIQYNSGNALTTIDAMYGQLTLQRDFTTLNLGHQGTVNWDGDGDSGLITGGVLNQYGGMFKWMNGNLGNITLKGGELDMSGVRKKGLTGGTLEAWASSKQVLPKADWMPSLGTETSIGGGSEKSYK